MISEKHKNKIIEYADKYGRDEACRMFGITKETFRSYTRTHRDYVDKPVDQNIDNIIKKLTEKYSPGELKSLADDKFSPTHGVTEYSFCGDVLKFAVLSDMHIGSQYTNDERVMYALDECIEQDVKLVLFSGDVTEGMSGRDGHIYELQHIGFHEQRKAVIDLLSPYKEFFDFKMISGNHDLWYASKSNMGALIVKDICEALGAEYLGEHEAIININGIRIMLWHGEDGASYALSYRVQKIIESLSGGEKPNILITGHDHKQGYFFTRNIHTIMGGCLQKQTPWMRRKRLAAHEGFWIIEATISESEVKKLKSEWIPFYI